MQFVPPIRETSHLLSASSRRSRVLYLTPRPAHPHASACARRAPAGPTAGAINTFYPRGTGGPRRGTRPWSVGQRPVMRGSSKRGGGSTDQANKKNAGASIDPSNQKIGLKQAAALAARSPAWRRASCGQRGMGAASSGERVAGLRPWRRGLLRAFRSIRRAGADARRKEQVCCDLPHSSGISC